MPVLSSSKRSGRTRQSVLRRFAETVLLAALLVVGVPSLVVSLDGVIPGPVPARVLRVIDGDTIIVKARIWLDQELETRVRLDGVDAPELKGKCAEETRLAVRARDLVVDLGGGSGAEVRLFGVEYGKFARRVVARVETLAGVDFSKALIETGLGRPYDGGRRGSWC